VEFLVVSTNTDLLAALLTINPVLDVCVSIDISIHGSQFFLEFDLFLALCPRGLLFFGKLFRHRFGAIV
jgi:hypothetical protein